MLLLILNMAVSCWGQNQQLTTPDFKNPQSQQVVQNSLNQKYSVYGGTVTGQAFFSSSTFHNGITCDNSIGVCIKFSDGTTQNTAPTPAPSTAFTTSGSTLTITSISNCPNTCLMISTSPSLASSISFTGLPANNHYRISVTSFTQQTANGGQVWYTFNGDATSAHYNQSGVGSAGSGSNGASASNCTTQEIATTNFQMNIGTGWFGDIDFSSTSGPVQHTLSRASYHDDTNNRYTVDYFGCEFTNGPVTQITVFDKAGQFNATLNLWKIE